LDLIIEYPRDGAPNCTGSTAQANLFVFESKPHHMAPLALGKHRGPSHHKLLMAILRSQAVLNSSLSAAHTPVVVLLLPGWRVAENIICPAAWVQSEWIYCVACGIFQVINQVQLSDTGSAGQPTAL
jgi:hypothetical protein